MLNTSHIALDGEHFKFIESFIKAMHRVIHDLNKTPLNAEYYIFNELGLDTRYESNNISNNDINDIYLYLPFKNHSQFIYYLNKIENTLLQTKNDALRHIRFYCLFLKVGNILNKSRDELDTYFIEKLEQICPIILQNNHENSDNKQSEIINNESKINDDNSDDKLEVNIQTEIENDKCEVKTNNDESIESELDNISKNDKPILTNISNDTNVKNNTINDIKNNVNNINETINDNNQKNIIENDISKKSFVSYNISRINNSDIYPNNECIQFTHNNINNDNIHENMAILSAQNSVNLSQNNVDIDEDFDINNDNNSIYNKHDLLFDNSYDNSNDNYAALVNKKLLLMQYPREMYKKLNNHGNNQKRHRNNQSILGKKKKL
mmetsp:Transcript_104728/g.127916  ORF Transcript_104728/g.127916 Transcript_104728/m.127916 type:complete len:380 (+) Transcript_104728:148-1287(+)